MHLSRLIVRNFRSIKYLDIPFSRGKNVIVGKNNAGKSNIVKALNLVLGEKYPTFADVNEKDYYSTGDGCEKYFWILCCLQGDDIDIESIKDCRGFFVGKTEAAPFNRDDLTGEVDVNIEHLFFEPDEYYFQARNARVYKKSSYDKEQWAESLRGRKVFFVFLSHMEEDSSELHKKELRLVYKDGNDWFVSWGLSKQVRDAFITSAIVDSFRDTPSQLRITNYTWYGKLVKQIWEKKKANTDESGMSIQEQLNGKFQEVQFISNKIFSDVAATIQETINISFKDTSISFQLAIENRADIHKGTQIYVDDGFKSNIADKGSGIQSAIIINLFSYYCYLFHRNTSLLIIEEPELYLHPQARRNLSDKLEKFVRLRDEKENQVILTTHSAEFISAGKNLNGITIVRKDLRSTRANHYSFLEVDTKELQTLLRNENSEMFFADKVALVEGAEKYLLPAIADAVTDQSGVLDEQNVSIIRTSGKGEFHKYFRILQKCQIECYVLADRDLFFNGIANILPLLSIPEDEKRRMQEFAQEIDRNSVRDYKNTKSIEARTIKPEQSSDAKALCEALEELAVSPTEQKVTQLQTIWEHIRPRVKKKDVMGYMIETGKYEQFMAYRRLLWNNNIYILEKGELEDYYTKLGRQVPGGKEEKVINILRGSEPENGLSLDDFIDAEEYKLFIRQLIYG